MLSIRSFQHCKCFRNNVLPNGIFQQSTATSQIKPIFEDNEKRGEEHLKIFETLKNITKKVRPKKPNRPPFAKNLFLGRFDNEMLTFPQLEKEDNDILEKDCTNLKKMLQQSHMVNCTSLSDKFFRQNLSDYKAIGLQASQLLDAKACNVTESSRILETLCEHSLAQSIVTHEQLGVQTLVSFANDTLKKKYLYPIIKGESVVALCLSETDCVDIASFKTKAELSQDKKVWTLNGEKTWVFNGGFANYFIVFALTKTQYIEGIKKVHLCAFLVDKDAPGISIQNHDISGINVVDVFFNDTPVSVDNIIGNVDDGEQMLKSMLIGQRLVSGPMCIALSKKILHGMSKFILENSSENNPLHKTDAMRGKIAEIITTIYAMESMVYLTTGLIDNFENQDVELESAIVKVYCTEQLLRISSECLDIMGAPAASNSHWANEMHREAMRYLTLHESNDSLKVILVLLGLQHAGIELQELVTKLRNPMSFANFHVKNIWKSRKDAKDDPKLNLYLQEHLHPSLTEPALTLDYCVQRLRYGTQCLLAYYGQEVVSKHMELKRLANCVIDMYALVAVLGRASRSYCIGLQNSDMEIRLANSFTISVQDNLKANMKRVIEDQERQDVSYRILAKNLFKFKKYYLEHPLKRNF